MAAGANIATATTHHRHQPAVPTFSFSSSSSTSFTSWRCAALPAASRASATTTPTPILRLTPHARLRCSAQLRWRVIFPRPHVAEHGPQGLAKWGKGMDLLNGSKYIHRSPSRDVGTPSRLRYMPCNYTWAPWARDPGLMSQGVLHLFPSNPLPCISKL